MFKTFRPPPRPNASRTGFSGLFSDSRFIAFGLVALIASVTGIGVWNQQRLASEPKASFSISETDLIPDDLSVTMGTSLTDLSSIQASGSGSSSNLSASQTTRSSAAGTTAVSPKPSATPDARVAIAGKDVNLRQQPSRQAPLVARSQAGATYLLTGKSSQADDLDWVEIEMPDKRKAWVSAAFVAPLKHTDIGTEQDPIERTQSSAPTQSKTSPSTPPSLEPDDVEKAAELVSQLLLAPGQTWPQADDALRQLTVRALLKKIFKDKPEASSKQHAQALNDCMSASSKAPDLQNLKVYELSVACALALNWR